MKGSWRTTWGEGLGDCSDEKLVKGDGVSVIEIESFELD